MRQPDKREALAARHVGHPTVEFCNPIAQGGGLACPAALEPLDKPFAQIFYAHVAHELQNQLLWRVGLDQRLRIPPGLCDIQGRDIHIDFEEGRLADAESIELQVAAVYLDVHGETDIPACFVLRRTYSRRQQERY